MGILWPVGAWWFEHNLSGGTRVAIGDGVGAAWGEALVLARSVADPAEVDLLLGWAPDGTLDEADLDGFGRVRTIMGGYALRGPIDRGRVGYLPCRLAAVPALLHGPLRRDVLIATVTRHADGHRLCTESAWQRAAVDAGAVVLAIERSGVPALDAGPPLPTDRLVIAGACGGRPVQVDWTEPGDIHRAVGERVAGLIPEGARVQYGPGAIGTAVLEALRRPVHIDTGMLTDAVVDLDRRGMLLGTALAPYSGGTDVLYDWAPGRATVDRVELTHDPSRLVGGLPFFAVNTALEVDVDGQVNVESVGGSAVAGIGGHPDFALGSSLSLSGLSIVAVPTMRGRHPTLVDRLSGATSTASHDVDVVVTELGVADLRGLDRSARRRAIAALWP